MLCPCPNSNWILAVCNHTEWIWSSLHTDQHLYLQSNYESFIVAWFSEAISVRSYPNLPFCGRATGICHAGGKWWTSAPWPSSSSCSDRNRRPSQWMAEEKGGVLTPGTTPPLSPTLSCPWWGPLLFPSWSYCEICLSSRFKGLMGSRLWPINTAASFFFCRSPEK